MKTQKTYIKVSPEVLKSDIVQETYSGNTFGVYSGLTEILSGGTNGDSLLTGLTIPIIFTQSFNDLGYYTPFDGYILQKNVVNNFVYSGNPNNFYEVFVFNTADRDFKKFLQLADYVIDWGDGSSTENINETSPDFKSHIYPFASAFTVTITQTNPWGTTEVKKEIKIPMSGATIPNPEGSITFTPQGGNWSGTPLSYDFIFSGDAENNISSQVSSKYTNIPFIVSGYTSSRLTSLSSYGSVRYATNVPIFQNGQLYGVINELDTDYTAYTINNVDYYDYPDGTTLFIENSSGITANDISVSAITKQEVLLDMVSSPEIQSEVFIDRGKNSAFEGLERLGEVDNLGDLTRYGYGFYKINEN
jgi:hypothetical protein